MSSTRRRSPVAGSRRRAATIWLVVGLAAAVSGCTITHEDAVEPPATRDVSDVTTTTSASADVGPASTIPVQPLDYAIQWEALSDRVDRGRLTVPVDYADPQGATMELEVARHKAPAGTRIGVLATNNGGPGAAASTMALNAPGWFPTEITDRFDVVSWDPRGTGASGGSVDCIDDAEYDQFYAAPDLTPDDDAERQALVDLAEDFAARCVERVSDLVAIGTNNTARDLDAIRQALGEEQISYFGFSYGSELGGVWATMFPTTVRAAVFDGATDPYATAVERARDQWIGFEAALNSFLAQCSADSDCAFHNGGDAEGAFDALMTQLDSSPLPSADGRAPVNREVATTAVVQSMYNDRYWEALARSLEDAQAGNGAGLLQLNDAYYQRQPDGTYSNLVESFQAISCMDDAARPTVEQSDTDAEQLIGVAPRLFPYTTGTYRCTFFPPTPDPRIEITGVGAGPIVVIGTTGDPSTPLASSRAMADALEDGRFVIVEAQQHTGYQVNDCVDDIVEDYLVNLVAPPDETTCA
jgi:pimeloyl-ACP methyl ester carboxylesterase